MDSVDSPRNGNGRDVLGEFLRLTLKLITATTLRPGIPWPGGLGDECSHLPSAAEFFAAAGFQDHHIGTILGVDNATGAARSPRKRLRYTPANFLRRRATPR